MALFRVIVPGAVLGNFVFHIFSFDDFVDVLRTDLFQENMTLITFMGLAQTISFALQTYWFSSTVSSLVRKRNDKKDE